MGASRPKMGVSTQNPALKFVVDVGEGTAVAGVMICRTLLFIVILLLFNRVNVGADDDVCKGAETSRTLCGV